MKLWLGHILAKYEPQSWKSHMNTSDNVYSSGLHCGRNRSPGAISCIVGMILWFKRFVFFVSRGAIFAGWNVLKFWNDSKRKQYLLLRNQSNWCTFDPMVHNKGYETYRTSHVITKLTLLCVTLHCTKYPWPMRLSLVRNRALRFSQRLSMCTV